ncbi:MAG: biotin/lipoyl-binding protein, partial [Ectothiorhodospiraceae bacterium]
MSAQREPGKDLRQALEDHSAEGVTILMSEPSRLIRGLIWVLFALLVAAGAWSFIGRADVTVSAQGVLGPEQEERRIHSPVDGELVDIYVAEGMPVSKGDVLARLNAVNAVELATRAMEARLRLGEAERREELLPARKQVIEQQLELFEVRIEAAEAEYEKRRTEAMAKLAEEQKIRLQKARTKLQEARGELAYAEREARKYRNLYESAGGGGVSRQEVEAREREYRAKRSTYELARAELAQFEVELGRENRERREEIRKKSEELLQLRADYQAKKLELDQLENEVEAQLRIARATYEGAARVTFDDIDE